MINSQLELSSKVGNAMQAAMNNTTKIALEELLRLIDEDVYSYPDTWTNGGGDGRTMEWRNIWDKTKATFVSSLNTATVQAEIGQMMGLTWHPPFSHGSIIKHEGISADDLSTIINEGLRNTGIGFPAMPARPFWSDFKKWCDSNLTPTFVNECRKQGLPISTTLTYSIS